MEEKSRILKKANDDKSRPVSFKDSFGGSESQFRLLLKHVPDENFKDINLILNSTNFDLLEKDKINVLWMHHFVNQNEAKNLASKEFVNKVLKKLDFKIKWVGKGLNEKAINLKNNRTIIECKKRYFRPVEVDYLKGNANKARKRLKWFPKTSIENMIDEMIEYELENSL